jgi:azurin
MRSRRHLLKGLLAGTFGIPWSASPGAERSRVELRIATDGDLLAFKPDRLSCPSGAAVHLIFHHNGKYVTQEHNWVLVQPGAADAVAAAGLAAGEAAGYVPHADARVLAASPLCGKGQEVSVDFIAPAAGDYPFICTNPGHAAVMHGVLHVTPN